MKRICLIIFFFTSMVSYAQTAPYDTIHLSISPLVNQQDSLNQKIIATLTLFLNSKDSSYTENKYWSKSDFEKYTDPYGDLEGMDAGKLGKHYYQPSLMEIVETDRADRKIAKVAFVGHNEETKANLIKAIYNIVATKQDDNIVFSAYMDYITKDWKKYKENNILYNISPDRTINHTDVIKQNKAENILCKFLNTKRIPITFYSCTSPKELFEILGFDYHPNMYSDTSGGWSRDKNIVISANKSEYYMHEVTHIYLKKLIPSINPFFNEGFATYIGGSGKYDYQWQKSKLLKFLNEQPDFNFEEHVDDPRNEVLLYEHETPIPYLIAAIVCERILRLYGKERLFETFRSNKDVFDTLQTVGITRENINEELRKEIKLPPTNVLLQARQTQRSISNSNFVQFQRNGTQVSSSSNLQCRFCGFSIYKSGFLHTWTPGYFTRRTTGSNHPQDFFFK